MEIAAILEINDYFSDFCKTNKKPLALDPQIFRRKNINVRVRPCHLQGVRILESRFYTKYIKTLLKFTFFEWNREKCLKTLKICKISTKIVSKTHRIAKKHRKNEVLPLDIRFGTDFKRKIHKKPSKTQEICMLRSGRRVQREDIPNDLTL